MGERAMTVAAALALLLAAGPRQHLGPPVPAQVRKVVTLAPSLSEMVLALGAGDRLAGVTRFDDDPRVAKLPRIGGYNDPQPEAVLELKPDLVLAEPAPANRGPVTTLARLGVPVEAFPLATVADIEEALVGIGKLLGREARGRELKEEIEKARAHTKKVPGKRVLLVFGLDPLVVAGPRSFAGELLADTGAENAAGDSPQPFFRMNAEAAVRARPEVIVLCGVELPAGRALLPGLEKVRVATLRSTALLHPGPRLPEALSDLLAAIAP
jgi:iron complex transport system substrate-binding protein